MNSLCFIIFCISICWFVSQTYTNKHFTLCGPFTQHGFWSSVICIKRVIVFIPIFSHIWILFYVQCSIFGGRMGHSICGVNVILRVSAAIDSFSLTIKIFLLSPFFPLNYFHVTHISFHRGNERRTNSNSAVSIKWYLLIYIYRCNTCDKLFSMPFSNSYKSNDMNDENQPQNKIEITKNS